MQVRKDAGLSTALRKVIDEVKAHKLAVGWGENQRYPDTNIPIAGIAAQNEFGNTKNNIPPRPFMRPAMRENGNKWVKTLSKLVSNAMSGGGQIVDAFETTGLMVAADVRKAIKAVTSPALKTATVKARLRGKKQGKSVSLTIAKPLVDSGVMLNSVTSEVQTK